MEFALQTGNQPSLIANTSRSSVASTKLGTAVNNVEKKTIILSGSLFRISAAMLPNTVPSTSAMITAVSPSLQEIGKDSPIMADISLPFFRETPKSPWSIPFIQRKNWLIRGLSRLYLSFKALIVASLRAFSLLNGPPGTACIVKNVIAQIMKIVRIASKMRLIIYLVTFSTPFLFFAFVPPKPTGFLSIYSSKVELYYSFLILSSIKYRRSN